MALRVSYTLMLRGRGSAAWLAATLALASSHARAEETDYAVAPRTDERDQARGDGLAAAKGWQVAISAALLFPVGSASGAEGDRLPARYAWQPGLGIEAGWRFARSFFVGGYVGASYGDTGNDARVDWSCNMWSGPSCHTYTWRIGAEGIYSFDPGGHTNPWAGYGIGLESGNASFKGNLHSESVTSLGLTFAKLSGGFDNRAMGAGLFGEVALGQYLHTSTTVGNEDYGYSIEHGRVHAWLMVGVRMVINP